METLKQIAKGKGERAEQAKEIISENELTDMFGEGGKEEVKEFYSEEDKK